MSPVISPRLPGVPLLQSQATGPEYSRWRRSIKFALQTRDLWKYCNGKCPMPMPEAGPNALPPSMSTTTLQPSLLEERRAWVKQDREVKLDIFLSLTEEAMQEVFEVGPPLPPSSLNAQQMIRILDKRFTVFKFEAYHHAFCHFLNLHVDQYESVEAFNKEFSATLEDLVDHGHPLSNTQACSAYFSKLRCTQNPWVAKMLEEWDIHHKDIGVLDLIKESPPWFLIKPLAAKLSQTFCVDAIPEENLEDSDESDSDATSKRFSVSTGSSLSLHSRQNSNSTAQTVASQDSSVQRQLSTITAHSQEITIHVSEDIAEIDPNAFQKSIEELPPSAIPERGSSKNQVPGTLMTDGKVPDWLSAKKSIARRPLPAPHNRPLPPIPSKEEQAKRNESRPRSASPQASGPDTQKSIPAQSTSKEAPRPIPSPRLSDLGLETTHPSLRPTTPTEIHPALRNTPPPPRERPVPPPITTTPPPKQSETDSSSSLAIPWPSTPDLPQRPHSSRATLPFTQAPNPHPSQAQVQSPPTPLLVHEDRPRSEPDDFNNEEEDQPHNRKLSTTSSTLSLPLQGTRDSAWAYLYEAKGGYLLRSPPREHSVSPLDPTFDVDAQDVRPATSYPASHLTTQPPPLSTLHTTSTPYSNNTAYSQSTFFTAKLHRRNPTFEDSIIPHSSPAVDMKSASAHTKSSSLDFVARLSGDSIFSSSESGREGVKEKSRKKKTWSLGAGIGMGMGKFGGKGVREII